ncbi:MAG: hypothetical protein DCC75_03970 [Proteobacteria bacterium]|nr:MAG: hypothetical protein DCC75_03970 [Pseudomonadota bacterium]
MTLIARHENNLYAEDAVRFLRVLRVLRVKIVPYLYSLLLILITQSGTVLAEDDQLSPLLRQRPGEDPRPTRFKPYIYESVPDINSSASDFVPVPDRWRQFYTGKWYDPYNQNVLKGDIPVFGSQADPWFFELGIISDTSTESRRLPTPVGAASTNEPEATDLFGDGRQFVMAQNLIMSLSLYKGNTAFKPQDFEFRFTPAFNLNYADFAEDGVLRVDPSKGDTRTDNFIGIQELFADVHLANITERYDFISTRFGVVPFISDFRGFVYNTSEPGIRFFGNYDNNIWQYNLAYFRRIDKDTNSGLNSWFEDRYEDVLIANVYHQDTPVLGHTVQANYIYRADNAGDHADDYDNNGFLVRPASIGDERRKNIHSSYFGLTGDGHYGRLNVTEAFYWVTGTESHNPIAGRQVDINAAMVALEASYDMDWMRFRASFMWASGDEDPFDDEATGFDAIFDNPNFAGGDISFWQRQGIPFLGGGLVNLVNRNSLLPDLRPGKEEGQSNYVNPGLRLYNLGIDFEITPKLKLINNASFLQFDKTEVIETLRQDSSIDRNLGWDLSSGLLYRPFLNNNVQLRVGTAFFLPQNGTRNLFGEDTFFDVFTNVILQY